MTERWIKIFTACLAIDCLCILLGEKPRLRDFGMDGAIASIVVLSLQQNTNSYFVGHRVYVLDKKNNWLVRLVAIACGAIYCSQYVYTFEFYEQSCHFQWLLKVHYPAIFEAAITSDEVEF